MAALSSLRFVRRLNFINRSLLSTSATQFSECQNSNLKKFKTEEQFVYLGDPDTFGSLSRTTYESEIPEDEGDIRETKHIENIPLLSQKLTIKQYADLIKQYVKHKRLKEAFDVLEVKMISEDRVKPESYIYNLLISACSEVGYTKKAFKLFNDMKRRALKPSGDTYTSLFHACANSPWPDNGLKNAKQLRAHMMEKGIEPNLTNYNAIIKAFGRCGDLPSAFQVVDEMISKKIKIRVHTFNHLLHACISDKNTGLRHAIVVWRKMLTMREKPNIYSFNLMLKCVKECNLGDREVIEELIASLREHINTAKLFLSTTTNSQGQFETTTKNVLPYTEHQKDQAISEDLIVTDNRNIKSNNQSHMTLSLVERQISEAERSIPNLLSKVIQMHEVLDLREVKTVQDKFAVIGGQDDFLKEMEVYSVKPDIKTFTQMVWLLDDTREAEDKLMETMKANNIRTDIDFYNMLIKKRCFRSDYAGAFEIKDMIMKESKRRRRKHPMKKKIHLTPNIMTYGVLAMACDTKQKAEQLLSEMEEKQLKVNIEILGALLWQGTIQEDFDYIFYIIDVTKKNDLKLNSVFVKHLECFKHKCVGNIRQKEKHSEDYIKACKKYLRMYKTFKKDEVDEEFQTEHPWQQFKEPYHEPLQRENIIIKKPKMFYKTRKFIRYKPKILQ